MHPSDPGAVLVLSSSQQQETLTTRLRGMGFAVLTAQRLEEAVRIVQRLDPSIGAVLLPAPSPLSEPQHGFRLLREMSPDRSLRFVLLGGSPTDPERTALRGSGLALSLCDPFTEAELRFVTNYVLFNPRQGEARRASRVPTRMLARVATGTGEKDALVYSLSLEGAFLETPRPSQPGTSVAVELPLPSGLVRAKARVLAANVPGSAYRRHVPRGMGVRFDALEEAECEHLERYIEQRERAFQL